jgi:quinol monooxygenase YgiN
VSNVELGEVAEQAGQTARAKRDDRALVYWALAWAGGGRAKKGDGARSGGDAMAAAGAGKGPLVIIAEFEVRPEAVGAFLEQAVMDASQSVTKEPGCRQFDVTLAEDQPNRVVLCEIYDDQAAFDVHLETPHLKAFRDAIEPLVLSRQVRRLTRVHGS